MTDQSPFTGPNPAVTARVRLPQSWGWLKWLAPGLAGAGLLAWGIAAILAETIDDDPDFRPPAVAERESRAVAMAAQLVLREVDQHKWVANDPFFQPGWMLDNMPAFQQGILAAISRFAAEMSVLAAGGGDSDPNLERAIGYFKYPGNVWMFDPSTSWAPTASSEKQYRAAARNLIIYNTTLATGDAVFDRRPEALKSLLAHLGTDLDTAAAEIDSHLAATGAALIDTKADDLFYATKGRLYAHSLLLRELGRDFASVLDQRELGAAWGPMVLSLRRAAMLEPLVVSNGAADGTLLPSHLTAQGFHLLRARSQLAAVAARL